MPSLKCFARPFRLLEGYAGQSVTKRSSSRVLGSGLVPPSSLNQSERETENLSPDFCPVRSMVG
jgi:hypothetical protein